MTIRTLLLTPWMTPCRVIPWQRAVVLSFLGKVEVVEEYDVTIAAPSLTIRAPAVVRQRRATTVRAKRPSFSRTNVFVRDGFTCQYCREVKTAAELNLDHVLPRSRGGVTAWENIVTSCYACNQRKAGRTPEEAKMSLPRRPFRPTSLPSIAPVGTTGDTPAEWQAYCA
ncbi:MAG: HNH endonuclease [Polyangiaceae bacterium]|nr:HNH endonuclease [Polyangiaceae bacterium]